ncbi:hypothetical protein [Streptomyces sp. NPDC001658]
MTAQITESAAQEAEAEPSSRLRSYMVALSLAEQIISDCTGTLPTSFEVLVYPWAPTAPELRFYFHRDVPGMRQFRDDQMLTETMQPRENGAVLCEAVRDDVRGVRVVAWTLTDPKSSAVAA